MKKLHILIASAVFCSLILLAQTTNLTKIRETIWQVKPNSEVNAATMRVTSGELFLDRKATFTVELWTTNSLIIDKESVTLGKAALKQWLDSTNASLTLKKLILNKLDRVTDDTNAVVVPIED